MKIKRKKILKAIRKEAKKLPPENYFAIDLFYQPKWSNEDNEYKRGEVKPYPVNHARRMKKIYDKWGIGAVKAYILIKNKKNEEEMCSNSLPPEYREAVSKTMD